MSQVRTSEIFQSLTSAWESAINERRPRAVILSGLLAYVLFGEEKDEELEKATLIYVRKAIDDVLKGFLGERSSEATQRACSFCGRTEPTVRLAAGARGFICDSCVSLLVEGFKEEIDK